MDQPEKERLLMLDIRSDHRENDKESNKEEISENNGVRSTNTSQPLIDNETERMPPLAHAESDGDGAENKPIIRTSEPNIHNKLFGPNKDEDEPDIYDRAGGGFPFAPGFGPGTIETAVGSALTNPESIPDVNIYQHKKTVAQGMMDLALFSANANQLRYVLDSGNHPYYYPGIVLITISLIFQVAVGVGLLWNTRYNVKDEKQICIANKVNNFTVVGIFLVTVINVFISAFGVATNSTSSSANT